MTSSTMWTPSMGYEHWKFLRSGKNSDLFIPIQFNWGVGKIWPRQHDKQQQWIATETHQQVPEPSHMVLAREEGQIASQNESEHILRCLSRQGIHLHDMLSVYFSLTWTWGVSLEPCLDGAPEFVAGKDTLMTLDRLGSTLVLPDSH